jgi:metal-responsive CopG/Arc/MetJ family transcriptional regulator
MTLRKKLVSAAAPARAKKISVDLPNPLYKQAEAIVHARHISTSVFVREAVKRYIEEIRQEELDRLLEEGYKTTAEIGDRIHKEFAFADAEQS